MRSGSGACAAIRLWADRYSAATLAWSATGAVKFTTKRDDRTYVSIMPAADQAKVARPNSDPPITGSLFGGDLGLVRAA